MKKLTIFLAFLLFVGFTVQAQMQISGTVTGAEDGLSIPGVSVVVKDNPTIGTTTDMDGKYSLTVPSSSQILVFTFVGMKSQEVAINNRTIIDVQMESDVLEMDEVVVTALGITRERKSLGYTVQDVKGDDLVKASNPNVVTAISGKIAGVEVRQSSGMPGAPAQIFIRGARSFSASNTPLYVVDGMPISSDNDYASNVTGAASANRAIDIDPNDIESVNVLKGQAAAALYGLRASNGVIIITTKKGKSATLGNPVVSFNSGFTMDVVSRLPEVQQTYAQGYYEAFAAANSYSWGPKITDLPDDPTYGGNNYAGHDGEFFDPYKGEWVTPKAYNNAENFYDRNGYTYSNSLNIANATSIGNYSVGLGATNQTGIIEKTGMDRYTAKMAADLKLAEKWDLAFSGNYSDINIQKLPSGNDSWLFTVYGAPASFDLKGTPSNVPSGTDYKYRQISYRRGAVGVNPYWAIDNNHFYEKTRRFFGNTNLTYKPFNFASIKYQLGLDTYTTDNENYLEMGYGNLPAAAQYPTPANPVYAYVTPTGGSIAQFGISRRVLNSLLTINLSHEFTEDLKGNLLIGNEIDDNYREYYSATGNTFTTPGWNNLDNCTIQYSDVNTFHNRSVGFFGNLSVDYKNMLFLNATGRYDVISSMPRDNRGFFYPSVSLGWIFTELSALKNQTILTYGKARASYAEVGQAATNFNPEPVYVTGGGGSGFIPGMSYPIGGISGYKLDATLYDPNLKPQNTSTIEFGIELKFFNNRLGIDYSYFDQTASDQIFVVPLAGSTGYSGLMMNAGKMSSKGHEIILTATPVKIKALEWNITANFTKIVNEVIELADGVDNIFLGGYTTPNIRASAGDTYPAIYGEQYLRDSQGRILVDDDPASFYYGMPIIGEFGKIGEVSPDFLVGLTNSFTLFKYVTLSAQIDWKQGGEMYSGSNRLMDLYGASAATEDRTTPYIFDGYKSDGTKNDIERGGPADIWAYPDLYNDIYGTLSEKHIYETSFVKLREVSLSISIPKKYIQAAKLEKASIGFVARNFLLWTTLPNFDPETSQGQGNMQGGMDYMSLPQTTSYGVNLNLTF